VTRPSPPTPPSPPARPTPEQIAAAADRLLPDVIGPGLKVLFCGINPSLYSAAVGHHFARPGNRFWPALHAGGFTPRRFSPFEDRDLLAVGLGLTNVVARATTAASEVSAAEFAEGGRLLLAKAERFRPACIAVLGVSAYRVAFARPKAALGLQPDPLGPSRVWVLPNPSGLNAHFHPPALARLFAELREAVEQP
jgi:TDG/mug DNA glycosylase family protein